MKSNRREFFIRSTSALALAATGGLGTTSKAYAQSDSGPDPTIYGAANACSAIVSNDAIYGAPSSQDWFNLASALNVCLNEWVANGRDAAVMAAMSSVSPGSITSDNLDQGDMLQYLQIFNPAFDLGDVQTLLAYIDTSQDQLPTVLSNMQANGLSLYIRAMAREAQDVAYYIDGSLASNSTEHKPRLMRVGVPRSTNGCYTTGVAIGAAGLAFAVIGVMSFGAAPVLVGAAWAGIAVWGGLTSAAAWAGQFAVCNS